MKRSAERPSDVSKKWPLALGVLGVVAAAIPIAASAHSFWVAIGLGMALLAAALAVATDADMDGPPPRRTG
ncbi:hypothetical protein [Halorussus halophilus]|uniref:hypothetical protein n=1 Tax=Halorussus halophilus TaxID=2650975 RepID=UPI001301320A|nr:hypothetical protein [Halorussus halophilus]